MVVTFERAVEELEKYEEFDESSASQEVLQFRKLVRRYSNRLKKEHLPIKLGKRTLYFAGAGQHKLMLQEITSGIDTISGATVDKKWVLWDRINPVIKDQIMKRISELQGGRGNVYKEAYKEVQEKQEETKVTAQEKISNDFVTADELYFC